MRMYREREGLFESPNHGAFLLSAAASAFLLRESLLGSLHHDDGSAAMSFSNDYSETSPTPKMHA